MQPAPDPGNVGTWLSGLAGDLVNRVLGYSMGAITQVMTFFGIVISVLLIVAVTVAVTRKIG